MADNEVLTHALDYRANRHLAIVARSEGDAHAVAVAAAKAGAALRRMRKAAAAHNAKVEA